MIGKPNYFKPRIAVCSPLTLVLSLKGEGTDRAKL